VGAAAVNDALASVPVELGSYLSNGIIGVVMKTSSAASATACFFSKDLHSGTLDASLSAEDLLRLATAITA